MCGSCEKDSDLEAVEACLRGSKDEFVGLVERYKGMVFSLAYRMTGNSWDAEDLSQEAFLRAYRNLGAFDKTRKFSTWLYTITLNLCRDRARRKRFVVLSLDRRWQEEGGLQVASAEPGPEERVEAREDADILQKCLAALARSDRELILLRYQLGLAYEAIAETLSVPVNRVKVRLHRARARLRKRFDKARK